MRKPRFYAQNLCKPAGLRRIWILIVLGCSLPAAAQTLNTSPVDNSIFSNNLTAGSTGIRSASSMGIVTLSVTGAVDQSVSEYSDTASSNIDLEYRATLTEGGSRGARVYGAFTEPPHTEGGQADAAHPLRSGGAYGLRALSEADLLSPVLPGAAALEAAQGYAHSYLPEPVLASSPGFSGQQAPSENWGATEPESAAGPTVSEGNGLEQNADPLEQIQDPFKAALGSTFEGLCAQDCGLPADAGEAGEELTGASPSQALTNRVAAGIVTLPATGYAGADRLEESLNPFATSKSKLTDLTAGEIQSNGRGGIE